MRYMFPSDISAESLMNYLPSERRTAALSGSHRRHAYGEVESVDEKGDGVLRLVFSRDGLYDILPEALFHPLDRFDNLPANEYRERFREECERQQSEESAARGFFAVYDSYLLELMAAVGKVKDRYADNAVLADIVGGHVEPSVRANRFVRRTWPYLPQCGRIRGNMPLLSLMIRKVLFDEGLHAETTVSTHRCMDPAPRYGCGLDGEGDEGLYLGNEFDEEFPVLHVRYWSQTECTDRFAMFLEEMKVYERFVNEFFVSICFRLQFDIETEAWPVRLSDEMCYNYLGHNTNL